MAGLRTWFRQVAEAVKEEAARQRGDDPGAHPGYGTYGNQEEPGQDAVWESEGETRRAPPRPWKEQSGRGPWSRSAPGRPAPASTTQRAGAEPADHAPWGTTAARTTRPHAHASPADAVSERIRARLGTPDALREAFVIKEVLDRPLARRRAR